MTVVEGRMFLYGRGFIGEVSADGSVQTLMDAPMAFVDGIALLDGRIFYADINAGALFSLGPAGLPVRIPLPLPLQTNQSIKELTAVGDSLYFSGPAETTGSFGEPIQYVALWRLDADGTATRLTGPGTGAPDIYDLGALYDFAVDAPNGPFGTPGPDTLTGTEGDDVILAYGGNDLIRGLGGNDRIEAGNGTDTVDGGSGNDVIRGGENEFDLRDVIFGGDGNDSIDGGYGNDDLHGGNGNDTVLGDFGSDTVIGNDGDDLIGGGGGSDLMFGNAGNDTLNGGFGFDRINGGTGADQFFHLGVADHGSDWIQDYSAAQGDRLVAGIAGATASQFQVNIASTAGAGQAGVAEAFVIYRPTGQVLWALVDGAAQGNINLQLGGQVFDLMA